MQAGVFPDQGPSQTHSLENPLWTLLSVGSLITSPLYFPLQQQAWGRQGQPTYNPQTSDECSLVACGWPAVGLSVFL